MRTINLSKCENRQKLVIKYFLNLLKIDCHMDILRKTIMFFSTAFPNPWRSVHLTLDVCVNHDPVNHIGTFRKFKHVR